jgi:threonine aldolase
LGGECANLRASELASVLQQSNFVARVEPVETNIVIFALKSEFGEQDFIQRMKALGILMIALGRGKLRLVTHRDYTDEQHQYVLTTLTKLNTND